jgi:hypothetical protein
MTMDTPVPGAASAWSETNIVREIRRIRRVDVGGTIGLIVFLTFAATASFVFSWPEVKTGVRYVWLAWAAAFSCRAAWSTIVESRRDAKAVAGGVHAARRRLRSLLKRQVESGRAKWLWLAFLSAAIVAMFVWLPADRQLAMAWLVIVAVVTPQMLYACLAAGPRATALLASLGEPSAAEIESNVREILDRAAGARVGRIDAIGYLHEEVGAAFMDAAFLVDGIATSSTGAA